MLKKIGLLLLLACSLNVVFNLFEVRAIFAATPVKTPKKEIPAKDLAKLARLTGLSTSTLQKYDLDTPATLRVYTLAVVSGNSFDTIYQNTDFGMNLPKFYQRNNVTTAIQDEALAKFNKLNAEFSKVAFVKDTYEGVNKTAVAELISLKLGLSKGDIIEYGFGSGIPLTEILTCAAVSPLNGNSFSQVIDKRKRNDSMEGVYLYYSTSEKQRADILALANSYTEDLQIAAKAGTKVLKVVLTPELTNEGVQLARCAGVPKEKVLEELKNGNTSADVKRAIVVSKRLATDISNILKIKNEGGWKKVYEYYLLNNTKSQTELAAIEKELNEKITPPPAVINR